jgi:SAM-dependent methyltransferase
MDVLSLNFPDGSFDAAYSMNSLLHVPSSHFVDSLHAIRRLLRPGALFYLGQYGGKSFEGVLPDDWHSPPRFFSFREDNQMRDSVEGLFELVDFHVLTEGMHFQSVTLRVPAG